MSPMTQTAALSMGRLVSAVLTQINLHHVVTV
jgi:hypothetical protein